MTLRPHPEAECDGAWDGCENVPRSARCGRCIDDAPGMAWRWFWRGFAVLLFGALTVLLRWSVDMEDVLVAVLLMVALGLMVFAAGVLAWFAWLALRRWEAAWAAVP